MKRTVLGASALLLIVLLALQAQVSSQSVTLAWNASSSPGIVGYEIHFGAARGGPYSQMQPVGNVTRATVSGLPLGETIYFAVKAVNDADLKSPFSNEVAYLVTPPSTPTPTPTPMPSPTPQSGSTITADRSFAAYFEPVVATVTNGPGNRGDYVVFCDVGEPLSSEAGWRYLNNTRQKPAVGLTNTSITRNAPNYPATMEFRLHHEDGTFLARSNPVIIAR